MDKFRNDSVETLAAKLKSKSKFSSYELLKGAVQAYSAKIAYGFKPSRADGKTRAKFVCSVD